MGRLWFFRGRWSSRGQRTAKAPRRRSCQLTKHPRQVALVGEAAFGRDQGQRILPLTQQAARLAHPQALQVISGSLFLDSAEHPRQVHGMHSGIVRQVFHAEILAELFV